MRGRERCPQLRGRAEPRTGAGWRQAGIRGIWMWLKDLFSKYSPDLDASWLQELEDKCKYGSKCTKQDALVGVQVCKGVLSALWFVKPTRCEKPKGLHHGLNQICKVQIFLSFFFLMFYLFLRERHSMGRGGVERGRHRIRSRLQARSCQHRARRRARTHEL